MNLKGSANRDVLLETKQQVADAVKCCTTQMFHKSAVQFCSSVLLQHCVLRIPQAVAALPRAL